MPQPSGSPYGTAGRLGTSRNRADFSNLPPWLQQQLIAVSEDESGPMYGFNGLRDERGREVFQLGEDGFGQGDNSMIDPSLEEYDPVLGRISPTGNIRHVMSDAHRNGRTMTQALVAAIAAAGAYGAMGAGSGGAFEGAVASGGAGAPEGLAGLGATGGGGGGGVSLIDGLAGGLDPTGATLAGSGAGAGGGAAGAGGLTSWLGNNAGNLGRLGLAALGASGSGSGGGGGGGSGGGSGAGEESISAILEQMANANRVNHNTPLGSRSWSQGADGRWTVNDAMNPAEQANFENVQGMNADVTGMARSRLAELLAKPSSRPRADAPLMRFGG